jgi:hypothetical protein
MKKWFKSLVFLFLSMNIMVLPSLAAEEPAVVVGRVYQVEGELLGYVPDEKDWVAVVKDAPFGAGDTLYSGSTGRAELIVPNGTWIRTGNSTQIEFIYLDTDLSEMDVASGVARFYNKSSDTAIKVTSPFGYVLAYPGTVFDFYVGDNSVEVVAVRGKVSFVHSGNEAKYDVAAGSPSILADQNQVSSGDGTVDPDWDRWNSTRENIWADKVRHRGRSANYLPPSLRDEAYTLEENGRWERVPYEGSGRWFWRPTTIAVGWSPFTMGRWTDWYGDQTWIPAEPFGYMTHHYGNWVYVSNNWYWAPPVASVQVGLPLLNVGFFWNPGRVSWIHSGAYVGWVPLAPRETYYSHRHWGGPHAVVVNNVNITRININVRNYAYANRAIVVNQNNFYKVNNYRNVRVTNINNTTIINNYRAAPVVNNTVINNYGTNKQRYNYTNKPVNQKPHNSVIKRIQQNKTIILKNKDRKEKAAVLQQQVKRTPEGRINRESRVAQPKIINRIVPAKEVNRPESEVQFQPKQSKRRAEGATETRPGQIARPQKQPVQPEQVKSERVKQARPALQEKPGKTRVPERFAPQIPGQPEKPGQIARPQKQPVRPAQVKSERVKQAPPALQKKPGKAREPERVAPQIPGQPEKPGQIARPQKQTVRPAQVGSERVKPAPPALQEKPGKAREPERVAPQIPSQPEKPGQIARPQKQPVQPEQVKSERVKQAPPALQKKPGKAREPERVAPQKTRQPEKPGQIARPKKPPVQPAQVGSEGVKPPRRAK